MGKRVRVTLRNHLSPKCLASWEQRTGSGDLLCEVHELIRDFIGWQLAGEGHLWRTA